MSIGARRGWAGGGSTTRWRKLRLLILARDGYECMIRGPRCTNVADTVDHILALVDGGHMWDETNLRASCKACNMGRRDHGSGPGSTVVEIRTIW